MAKQVIITAGHGNGDPGARYNGESEAELACWLRDTIAFDLVQRGCVVTEDGADGQNKGLRDAIALLKANPGVEAWEIHFNAGPLGACGVEVLAPVNLKTRAKLIARAISTVTQSPLRGEHGWKAPNAGAHHRLAFCEAGGGIIEVEFISNPEALKNYLSRRVSVAQAIAAVLAV